jgi:hypothetical protein
LQLRSLGKEDHLEKEIAVFPSVQYSCLGNSWTWFPFLSPGDLSDPEIEPLCLVSCVGRWVLDLQRHLGSPKAASLEENSVSIVGEKRARETLSLSHDV